MKKIILCFPFLLIMSCIAQDAQGQVQIIESQCQKIRNKLKDLDRLDVKGTEGDDEGVQTTGYFEGNKVQLLTISYQDDKRGSHLGFYFENEKLIFVFEQHMTHNPSFDGKQKKAKEDKEDLGPAPTTTREDRYYFHDEKLFLWLDNDNQEVDLSMGTNVLVGKGLLAHGSKTLNELREKQHIRQHD